MAHGLFAPADLDDLTRSAESIPVSLSRDDFAGLQERNHACTPESQEEAVERRVKALV